MPQFIFTAAIPSYDIPDTRFYIEANNPFEATATITLFEEEEEQAKTLFLRITQYLFTSDFDELLISKDWRISVPLGAFSLRKEDRDPTSAKDLHEYLWYMQDIEGFLRYGGVTNQEWVQMTDPFFLQKGIVQ